MHSHICAVFHIVFSTKQRTHLIPPAVQRRLWNYLAGIARNHRIMALEVGGTDNHVHLLMALPPDIALCDVVRLLKTNSSRFMRETSRLFAWQVGYGAFSVSPSQVARVRRYIANQAAHHGKQTYDEEFAALMQASNACIENRVAPEGAGEI